MGGTKVIFSLVINMEHKLNIPGRSLDSVLAGKMHKVFLYKFFRGTHAYKKPVFDSSIRKFSERKNGVLIFLALILMAIYIP